MSRAAVRRFLRKHFPNSAAADSSATSRSASSRSTSSHEMTRSAEQSRPDRNSHEALFKMLAGSLAHKTTGHAMDGSSTLLLPENLLSSAHADLDHRRGT
mmetsp:Transcript_23670/g.49582  ORF Transcript_23670/g.49582 Transcript_23670/m.49582 type:complete len:100 (-) Transcript_23670:334-633(-)